MNLIQLIIFFCQRIQFRSHKSRNINEMHFSNMWVSTTWLLFTNKLSILISHIYLPTCWFHVPFFILNARLISSQQIEQFWWRNFRSFQLKFRFYFPLLIFQVQIFSAQQIEQFWCLDNYKLLVSTEKQLADPLFSSYSVHI